MEELHMASVEDYAMRMYKERTRMSDPRSSR
jgi:hypothetical protein